MANIIINENYEKQRVSNYMIHIDSYIIISINTQVSYPFAMDPPGGFGQEGWGNFSSLRLPAVDLRDVSQAMVKMDEHGTI